MVGPNRGRMICFIDNSNIFKGQEFAGWRIDWAKFQNFLQESGQLWRTYFFASVQEPIPDNQKDFYTFLRIGLRWEVHTYALGWRNLTCPACQHSESTYVEKRVDVGLSLRMVSLAMHNAFDTALLVSGDGDYVEAVQYVKDVGKRVEVIAWQNNVAAELHEESSAPVLFLDQLRHLLER